jgi:hypothetical protein
LQSTRCPHPAHFTLSTTPDRSVEAGKRVTARS